MHKYAAIINCKNIDHLINTIKDLENQKHCPNSYFIVYHSLISKDFMLEFLDFIRKTNKKWKIKSPINKESPEYLIDEFFITDAIKEKTCLLINPDENVALDLSDRLEKIVNKEKWLYKIDNHQFFYTDICKYFISNFLEKGLIESGFENKIYSSQENKNYIEYNNT